MSIENSATNTSTNIPAHVAAFFAAFFPPLSGIFFIVFEKKNKLVRFHAMQSTVFGAVMVLGYVALRLCIHYFWNVKPALQPAIALSAYMFLVVAMVIWLINVIASLCSKEWEIPIIGRIARSQLNKLNARQS